MNTETKFLNRTEAGQKLAEKLKHYEGKPEVLVLALPRGGIPIAIEIAKRLRTSWNVLLVRKVPAPRQPELALGAIVGKKSFLNHDLIHELKIKDREVEFLVEQEKENWEKLASYYQRYCPEFEIKEKVIILVDDGIATGATVMVAILALRELQPTKIVVATPVLPATTIQTIQTHADELYFVSAPKNFYSVSQWYKNFDPIDEHQLNQFIRDLIPRTNTTSS